MHQQNQSEKIVQTAGREALGSFAPAFAHDDEMSYALWIQIQFDAPQKGCLSGYLAPLQGGVARKSL